MVFGQGGELHQVAGWVPPAVLALLQEECGLARGWSVVDVGSGTGILSEILPKDRSRVIGVEPNKEMREASTRLLRGYPGFQAVDGLAEATGLPPTSADLIAVAQSFHWFDHPRARDELVRILKLTGWVALLWNTKDLTRPFQKAYQHLLESHGTDYVEVRHENIAQGDIWRFFGPGGWSSRTHSPLTFQV